MDGFEQAYGSAHALIRAFRGVYRGSTSLDKIRAATISATIYHFWDIRNRKILEDESPDLVSVVRKIQILIHRLHALRMTYSYEDYAHIST